MPATPDNIAAHRGTAESFTIEDLLEAADAGTLTTRPDERPVLAVQLNSRVASLTRPPTFVVRLQLADCPAQLYALQRPHTAAEASLLALRHLIQTLPQPTRVLLGTDDSDIVGILAGKIRPPPWLRRGVEALDHELAIIESSISVEHLDVADCLAREPYSAG